MSTSAAVVESTQANASKTSTFSAAKRDINFLIDPSKNTGPDRRRTRTLLRTARYIGVFLFWRLVRYAKYAAVGAITAAIAGTAIGSVASGAAFVLAPPGIFAGAGVGLIWGLGKFGWRTMAKRVRKGDVDHANARRDEHTERQDNNEDIPRPPRTDPW